MTLVEPLLVLTALLMIVAVSYLQRMDARHREACLDYRERLKQYAETEKQKADELTKIRVLEARRVSILESMKARQ